MRVGRIDRPPFTVRGQRISVRLKDGRFYNVCSEGQMIGLREEAEREIIHDLIILGDYKDEQKRAEETKRRLDEWQKKCPFATLNELFAQMTPQEIEEWKDKYRFQGVWS